MGDKENRLSYASYLSSLGCSVDFSKTLSSTLARVVFFILLMGTLIWCGYAFLRMALLGCLNGLTLLRNPALKTSLIKGSTSLKRAFVCSLCLFSAIFIPGIGIMFACTYFIVHDSKALEELVPKSIRNQFLNFFKTPVVEDSYE